MKEAELVDFYVGLMKLRPELVDLLQHELFKKLNGVTEALFGIGATRDHVAQAYAKFTNNAVKRRWDLKFEYAIRTFLVNGSSLAGDDPRLLTNQEVHSTLKNLFDQRTRMSVVQSAREEACKMLKEKSPQELHQFIKDVEGRYQSKSKQLSFLS